MAKLTFGEIHQTQTQIISITETFIETQVKELTGLMATTCNCFNCVRIREILKHTKDFQETLSNTLAELNICKAESGVALTPLVSTEQTKQTSQTKNKE